MVPTTTPSSAPVARRSAVTPSSAPAALPSPMPSSAPVALPSRMPSSAPAAAQRCHHRTAIADAIIGTGRWANDGTPSSAPATRRSAMTHHRHRPHCPAAMPSSAPRIAQSDAIIGTGVAPVGAIIGIRSLGQRPVMPSSAPVARRSAVTPSSAPVARRSAVTPSSAPAALPRSDAIIGTGRHRPRRMPSSAPAALPSRMPSSALVRLANWTVTPSSAPVARRSAATPSSAPAALPSRMPSSAPAALPSRMPSSAPAALPSRCHHRHWSLGQRGDAIIGTGRSKVSGDAIIGTGRSKVSGDAIIGTGRIAQSDAIIGTGIALPRVRRHHRHRPHCPVGCHHRHRYSAQTTPSSAPAAFPVGCHHRHRHTVPRPATIGTGGGCHHRHRRSATERHRLDAIIGTGVPDRRHHRHRRECHHPHGVNAHHRHRHTECRDQRHRHRRECHHRNWWPRQWGLASLGARPVH